jgi:hypothetical protein
MFEEITDVGRLAKSLVFRRVRTADAPEKRAGGHFRASGFSVGFTIPMHR